MTMDKFVEYCIYGLIGLGVLFIAAFIVPALIKGFFWLLLQGMYYPYHALSISIIAMVALYLIDIKTKK
jgi:hypothetical protein